MWRPRQTVAAKIRSFRTLDQVLSGDSSGALPQSFQLDPVQVRRMDRATVLKTASQDHRAILASNVGQKGTWSYDWRIALFALKQRYREMQSRELDMDNPVTSYLMGRSVLYSQRRADEIPQPYAWSRESLIAYVDRLVRSKVTRVMQRHLYQGKTAHALVVHDHLMAIVHDPVLRPHLSPLVMHLAMAFHYKHSMMRSARKVFTLMVKTRMPLSTETFNVMLRDAARRKDLHAFTFLLRLMIRRQLIPSSETWVMFLMCVQSKVVKLSILKNMRELGLLYHKSTLQTAVLEVIPSEISSHVENGQDVPSFLQTFDKRYGSAWFSTAAANVMCQKLGDQRLMEEAVDMLAVMAERNCRPDEVTLKIFLVHCLRLRDMDKALYFLRLFKSVHGIRPMDDAFDMLFMLAWRLRLYNVCRVVWRVACVNAAVTYRMQELIWRSLARNTPKDAQRRTELWMKTAAKVIAGVDLEIQLGITDCGVRQMIMGRLALWSPAGPHRTALLCLAHRLLGGDLDAANRYRFTGSFIGLLARAFKTDKAWAAADRDVNATLEWKLQNAVDVEVEWTLEGRGPATDLEMGSHGQRVSARADDRGSDMIL